MITDNETNFVYFSRLLEKNYTEEFNRIIAILDKHNIQYSLLENTMDIWCRDYMPIQISKNKFVQFEYNPDYLKDEKWKNIISDPTLICSNIGIHIDPAKLKIDGGNIIKGESKAILTEKIFAENPLISRETLISKLKEYLSVKQIIIIPIEPYDTLGHSDGMIRFVDTNTVIANNYSKVSKSFHEKFQRCIKSHNLNIIEMPYTPCNEKNSDGIYMAKGAYLNYLQIGDLIIVPKFDLQDDAVALNIIKQTFPSSNVVSMNCNNIAEGGGVLNCISWNIMK